MSARHRFMVLFLSLTLVCVAVLEVQASLEPVHTVGNLFAAVNAGDIEAASDLFAPNAVAANLVTRQSYEGADEIRRFLDRFHRPGREYEIVQLSMAEDTVTLTVDIADRGQVWAQQKVTAVVRGGMIHSLEIIATRLTLWRILR